MAILELDDIGRFKDMRQAYMLVYQELKRLARKAAQVDCNVLFTAWTDLQEIMLSDGSKAIRTQPKLPNKILDNFLGLTQVVTYINTAEKDGKKAWYYVLEGRPTLYAKDQIHCRKSCMPEDIFSGNK
jgi:phage nucleotide-binding protein